MGLYVWLDQPVPQGMGHEPLSSFHHSSQALSLTQAENILSSTPSAAETCTDPTERKGAACMQVVPTTSVQAGERG